MAKEDRLLEEFERQQREFRAWRKAAEMDDGAQTDLVVSVYKMLPKTAPLSGRIVEISARMRELWGDLVDPRLFAAVFDLPFELDVDAELDAIIQADQSGEPLTEAQVAMAARFVSAAGAARQGDGGAEEKMTLQTDWIDLVVQCRKLIV